MDATTSFKKELGFILVGAIVFTASFLWKDFILDIEEHLFPKHHGLLMRFLFIVMVTIILVVIMVYLKGIFGLGDSTTQPDDEPTGDNNEDDDAE